MNKKIAVLLALIIVFTAFLTACSKKDKENNKDSSSDSQITGSDTTQNDASSETIPENVEDWNDESLPSNVVIGNGNTSSKGESDKNSSVSSGTNSKNDAVSSNQSSSSNNSSSKPSGGTSSSVQGGSSSDSSENSGENGLKLLTYEEYMKLTPVEQQKYYEKFENPVDFGKWYKDAKAEYDAKDDSIHVSGNGTLDLDKYLD